MNGGTLNRSAALLLTPDPWRESAASRPGPWLPSWEPPAGPRRVAGGLLGVVGGEADGWESLAGSGDVGIGSDGPGGDVGSRSPVAEALVELSKAYVADGGKRVPVTVARRYQGVAAPAWLLAVALVRPDVPGLVADTLELAAAAGVPRRSLRHCVSYVELAAGLLSGQPPEVAIEAASGQPPPAAAARAGPPLCGESTVDAVEAGMWALLQPGGLAEVMPTLVEHSTPGVGAAVAGLLGLRDGCGALPPAWHQASPRAAECIALTPGLVRARCTWHSGGWLEVAGAGGDGGDGGGCEGAGRSSGRGDLAGTAGDAGAAGWIGPVVPDGLDEATRPDGAAGSVPTEDVGCGRDMGRGRDVGAVVAAYAITEELEAIEERVPVEAASRINGAPAPQFQAAAHVGGRSHGGEGVAQR